MREVGTRSVRALVRKRGWRPCTPFPSLLEPAAVPPAWHPVPDTGPQQSGAAPETPAHHVPHDRIVQFASHFRDTPSVRAGKRGADRGYVRRPLRTGNAPDRPSSRQASVSRSRRHPMIGCATGGATTAQRPRMGLVRGLRKHPGSRSPTPGTMCRKATGSGCDAGLRASGLPETRIRQKARNGNRTGVPAGNGSPPRLPGGVPRTMVPARECPPGDWTGASPPHTAAGHRAAAVRPQVDACAVPGAAIVGAAAPERRKADIAHRIPGVAPGPPVRRRCAPITRRPRAASGISPPRLESRVKAHEDPVKSHDGHCRPRMPPLAFAPVSAHIAECPWL